jgi:signal peptidase I
VKHLMQHVKDRRKPTDRIGGERRSGDALRIADALHRCGRITLRVHGASMLPWVRPADIAIIRHTSVDNVRCGDVVLFRRDNRLFVHRIVERRGSLGTARFYAKGDAHPGSDGHVEEQELLGRVVRLYRGHQRIDLDAPSQLALGVLISQLSLHNRLWYPLARLAAIVTRPARRVLQALRFLSVAAR